jgi:hypothetical protein
LCADALRPKSRVEGCWRRAVVPVVFEKSNHLQSLRRTA